MSVWKIAKLGFKLIRSIIGSIKRLNRVEIESFYEVEPKSSINKVESFCIFLSLLEIWEKTWKRFNKTIKT